MTARASDTDILSEYTSEAGTDVFGLIRELGIDLVYETSLGEMSGEIAYDGNHYVISINASEAPSRQRFTAAHELAHYFLHRDLLRQNGKLNRHTDILFSEDDSKNPTEPFSPRHEVEANKYAARILMPAKLVKEHYDPIQDNVGELAGLFKVSRQAMEIRLANLGLRSLVNSG